MFLLVMNMRAIQNFSSYFDEKNRKTPEFSIFRATFNAALVHY